MVKETKGGEKHRTIISAARELFHSKGYEATSFTDIADKAGVNRGNFYYYFRTKDEILAAVTEVQRNDLALMFAEIEHEADTGGARLINYLDRFERDSEMRLLHGCAMGSLAMELGKGDRHLLPFSRQLFELTLDWIEAQFRREPTIGDPRLKAVETLARVQGVALLGSVLNSSELRTEQFGAIKTWITTICRGSPTTRPTAPRQKGTRSRLSPGADTSSKVERLPSSKRS